VIVVHDDLLATSKAAGRWIPGAIHTGSARGELDKLVHQAAVYGLLLIEIAMILVTGHRLRMIKPLWVGLIGIVGQQGRREAVDRGGARTSRELRLPGGIGRVGIRAEVVIKGYVLLKDDHHMLDAPLSFVI